MTRIAAGRRILMKREGVEKKLLCAFPFLDKTVQER